MGIRMLKGIMVSWVFALHDMEFADGGGKCNVGGRAGIFVEVVTL
jgi:hypothetical protein